MARRRKFGVYLAGPISGCNELQRHQWRNEVKKKYAAHFDFIDPTDDSLGQEGTPYEIVEADFQAIEDADGMLVNMWRESIGSAMGIVHAHRVGRPVVVSDPNRIRNRTLDFYADALTDSPLQAAGALLSLLRAEEKWSVIKSAERKDEKFDRLKLAQAIRAACRSAGQNDIVVPRLVLPQVIERLKRSKRITDDRVTAREIDRAVKATFSELEADSIQGPSIQGVLHRWERGRTEKHTTDGVFETPGAFDRTSDIQVDVSCGSKAHATIWGKTIRAADEIPSNEARRVFRVISGAPGITRITLGRFSHKESRQSTGAFVGDSMTPNVLEGKLYDQGLKGTLQTFQVRIQNNADKSLVLRNIVDELTASGYWMSG